MTAIAGMNEKNQLSAEDSATLSRANERLSALSGAASVTMTQLAREALTVIRLGRRAGWPDDMIRRLDAAVSMVDACIVLGILHAPDSAILPGASFTRIDPSFALVSAQVADKGEEQ